MRAASLAVLSGKFMSLNAYFRKEEKSQINNLNFYLKLGKKEQKCKANRRKEIIKIKV